MIGWELDLALDPNHELVRLATVIPWDDLTQEFGRLYVPDLGRPGIPIRLMAGLHLLKHTYALSDEDVVKGWVENPYWQHFCGEVMFQHHFPINPSQMTRWRKRIGEKGVEKLLEATIQAGKAILNEIIDNGGYVLSAETQDLRRAPLRLFWALLLRKLMRSVRPRPLNILMDEAKAAGKIPDVVNALVTLRNRQVSIWMSWQSEAAIASVYKKEEAEALVDAFGNRITLLHGISTRDAKQLSENMRSWSKKRGGHVGLNLGQSPSLSMMSGTDDIMALPLISAEDIENRGRRPGE